MKEKAKVALEIEALATIGAVCSLLRIGEDVDFIAKGLNLSKECVERIIEISPYYEELRREKRLERHKRIDLLFNDKGVENIENTTKYTD